MNFLSHYYFDRGTTNSYHTLGTVLPDLLKNADNSVNIHPERLQHTKPAINDMIAGWRKHLEVDRHFHSSDFFITRSHELKKLLLPAINGSPAKPFFIGHIALELILDNLLITTNKIAVNEFYHHLSSCNNGVIEEFLHYAGLTDTDQFFRFYESFKKSRYLETYAQEEKIAYAIKRICMRVWKDPFTPGQEEEMTTALTAYRRDIYPHFMSIFTEISGRLA